MSISNAYNDWSTTYDQDRNLTRDLDQQVMHNTFSKQRYRSVLEIGCGTGKNTGLLAQIALRVTALDFSQGMITQARAKVQAQWASFAIADLTQPWPCCDHKFDLIVCNLVLEHIPDLAFIFSQANRVLMKNGKFFICELHPFRQYQGKKATFATSTGQIEISAFTHHISDFVTAANSAGFALKTLGEWWHDEDKSQDEQPPRLVSFLFERGQAKGVDQAVVAQDAQ